MDSTGKIGNKSGSILDNTLLDKTDAVYVRKSTSVDSRADMQKRILDAFSGQGNGEDTVHLSIRDSVQTAFSDDSDERKKKLESIKAQIEAGTYSVDSRVVAREVASEIAQSIFFQPQIRDDGSDSILPK